MTPGQPSSYSGNGAADLHAVHPDICDDDGWEEKTPVEYVPIRLFREHIQHQQQAQREINAHLRRIVLLHTLSILTTAGVIASLLVN